MGLDWAGGLSRGHTLEMILPILLAALILQPVVSPEIAADQLDGRFESDLHNKQIDDILTLYIKDAVFVNPDGKAVSGPGLRKLYEQVTEAFDSDLHLKRTSLKRNLNTVIEDGTYTEELGHRDTGKIENVKGTYRFTLRREEDGRWLFSRMEWH
jgi:ketosteroid isomerase-like protein